MFDSNIFLNKSYIKYRNEYRIQRSFYYHKIRKKNNVVKRIQISLLLNGLYCNFKYFSKMS